MSNDSVPYNVLHSIQEFVSDICFCTDIALSIKKCLKKKKIYIYIYLYMFTPFMITSLTKKFLQIPNLIYGYSNDTIVIKPNDAIHCDIMINYYDQLVRSWSPTIYISLYL